MNKFLQRVIYGKYGRNSLQVNAESLVSVYLGLSADIFLIRRGLPVEVLDFIHDLFQLLGECLRNVQQHVGAMHSEEEP